MTEPSNRSRSRANARPAADTEAADTTAAEDAVVAAGGVPDVPGPEQPADEGDAPEPKKPTKAELKAAAERPAAEDALFARHEHVENAQAMYGERGYVVAGALALLDTDKDADGSGDEMLSHRMVAAAITKFLAYSPEGDVAEGADNTGGQNR